MSRALTKKEAQQQQLQQQQYQRDVETQEHHASANASAGLSLNLFGALSGVFSSKSRKTTHSNPDGSSHSVEDRHEQGVAHGYAAGQGTAYAQGNAVENGKKQKSREIGEGQQQTRQIKGTKQVDHLGIEN
ncbi:hypothetical protein K469DRAFT_590407 [Zopfia rhizophila CBS 207.26]|uniref:Uncharacterized protein n=1 Tax=Zopfia rhizophila CBS 207.26 TaxID=1314779 RepID=A0A6A6DNH3_9PEZI|nr:hypothetical protein K469DRAFT_590407 [Zopfia rhizophila CBS 207.26]